MIKELGKLTNLHGRLFISRLEYVKEVNDVLKDSLMKKKLSHRAYCEIHGISLKSSFRVLEEIHLRNITTSDWSFINTNDHHNGEIFPCLKRFQLNLQRLSSLTELSLWRYDQLRVSSEITNAPLILSLDCDMYSNNADTIREILCFFMDETRGDELAFVQFPQNYNNLTKNDMYAHSPPSVNDVEFAGEVDMVQLFTVVLDVFIEEKVSVEESISRVSSPWFLPFAYVFIAKSVYSLSEAMSHGSTLKAWWNTQKMWLIRRTSAYFIALVDIIKRKLGLSETTFVLTDKVVTEDILNRYDEEVMEFGSSNLVFNILSTLALLNLFCLVGWVKKLVFDFDSKAIEQMIMQVLLCGIIIVVNLPIYNALFIRKDKGSIPTSVMVKSFVLASILCLIPLY
ncbi:hypothetical protein F8388_008213 [Cannabis sativa]|uniref:Uncharacterized protein n=1 Tax=Cannabis sativa TaxID=3483 RepID=A0A7J6EXC1_CANSA|nr:hypothetical protein F8388_008213 [Cannabis sativa]KAF4391315.1 hypothetical protein G4B88_016625 [Cannabis sativa]